ncbi:MAG: tRNA pseudouridine(55) synthase TruB [Pyrinomonadaceae bacterium]
MNGIIIIDKPAGFTSHDVVAKLRGILRERRIGHTGTLDPFATGVMVMLVGRATRLAQFLSGAEKEYDAAVRLGFATDTGDLTGTPLAPASNAPLVTQEQIEEALRPLRGDLMQLPPMYSAKKVQGRKLYELARRGEEIERAPVPVSIRRLEVVPGPDGQLLRPGHNQDTYDLRISVVCSAGTYVRVLAAEIGRNLGIGAHLAALRRTRAGAFGLERALTLAGLQSDLEAGRGWEEFFIRPAMALSEMPSVHLSGQEAQRVRHGMALDMMRPDLVDGAHVRMEEDPGELIAIGVYDRVNQMVRPRVMLAVN